MTGVFILLFGLLAVFLFVNKNPDGSSKWADIMNVIRGT
jgi:hypothetical protein